MDRRTETIVPMIDAAELESLSIASGNGAGSSQPEPKHILWIRHLWDRRRFLARAIAAGLVLSTIAAFLIPARYQSTTQLMPPDQQSGGLAMLAAFAGGKGSSESLGGLGGSLGSVAGDLLGVKTSGALFTNILQSRTIEDRLVQRFDLRRVYWDRYWEQARKDLASCTEISEDKKSGVITVSVTDRDPRRAQQMAQAYVDELDRLLAEVSTSAARRERIFIEQRLGEVKHDLDNASKRFSEYASENTVIDMPSQTRAMVEASAELQGELIAAQSQLQGLEQIYTGSNVRVRSLQARVAELQKQLSKMGGSSQTANSSSPSATDTNPNPDDLYPSIRKLPLLGVRWFDLYRDTKIQETVYELLTQQYEVARIQEAKEIPTIKVLDPPELPERKSFPKRSLIISLGTFFAFALGAAFVIGSAVWQSHQSAEKQLASEIWADLREKLRDFKERRRSRREL